MRYVIWVLVIVLMGCSASTSAPTAPPSSAASVTVIPTEMATEVATPTSTATPTPSPTTTPTVTTTPTPTFTPTATATIEPVDVSAWQTPLVTAGLTVAVINALDQMATELQAGTLESIEAGGRLLGYQIALAAVAQALDQTTLVGMPARFQDDLRANLAGVFVVTDRWQRGEISSATVDEELAPVQATSEQTLAEILEELRSLGVSQAQIDEFLVAVNTALEP